MRAAAATTDTLVELEGAAVADRPALISAADGTEITYLNSAYTRSEFSYYLDDLPDLVR
jgi:hypothetical protein